jgi:polysaccharide export outer membrane protein
MGSKRTLMRGLLTSSLQLLAVLPTVDGQQKPGDNSQGPPDWCRSVLVLGAVHTPGRFEFRKNMHLSEVIACAGGLTDKAGTHVQVDRTSCPRSRDVSELNFAFFSLAAVLRAEKGSNPIIQPADIIVVLDSDPIYVVGYVVQPQTISPREPIRLTQAIESAGGVTKYSKTDQIQIIRETVGSFDKTVITVNLNAITKRRAADPVLQPFDIIHVPGEPHGEVLHGWPSEPFMDLRSRGVCRISF